MIILKNVLWFKCAPSLHQEESVQFVYVYIPALSTAQNTKLVEKQVL